jgi:hypothetical protein
MGMEAPVLYGTILGVVIVLLAFSRSRTTNKTPNKSLQATRDGVSSSAIADDGIRPACLSF